MIQIASLTPVKLEPYMDPRSARTLAFEFAPSQTLARGTVIAQLTAGGKAIAYAVASAKEVQTITITGTPTGGTFTLTLARGGVSATTAASSSKVITAAPSTRPPASIRCSSRTTIPSRRATFCAACIIK